MVNVGLFDRIKNIFVKKEQIIDQKAENLEKIKKESNYDRKLEEKEVITKESIHNEEQSEVVITDLWNYIDPLKNTQAYHVISVIGFEEWVDMQTIKDRVKQLFFIEYKNEKSLYPYIKTLVDIGLLETNSVGGKRQWKKRELLITINKEKSVITAKNKSIQKINN